MTTDAIGSKGKLGIMDERSGQIVEAKMKSMGLKNIDLSRRTGWTNPNFSNWFNGKTIPSDDIARSTCKIVGVKFADLLPILRRERFQKKLNDLYRKFSDVIPDPDLPDVESKVD